MQAKGFTLLEVMVALMMIGVLLPPLLLFSAQRIEGLVAMEERFIANQVAQNRLALTRLGSRLAGERPARVEEGEEAMAERIWYWRLETEPTEVEGYYRLSIEVSAQRGASAPLVSAQAYFGVD